MIKKIEKKLLLGGRELVLETGQLAPKADAAVFARCGGTVILATVVSTGPREDLDYFPLHVEYAEKLYAGGRIKGSRWVKREGRPSDEAVLSARLVDRSIRPLFPHGFKNEVQVVLTLLSVDQENDPSVLAAVAASAVLHISPIPWNGPLGVVRVGLLKDKLVINPGNGDLEKSDLNLIVSIAKEGIVMLEGQANQISEEKFWQAVKFAEEEGRKLVDFIDEFRREAGREKMKFAFPDPVVVKKIEKLVAKEAASLASKDLGDDVFEKMDALIEDAKEKIEGVGSTLIKEVVHQSFKKAFRKRLLQGERPGGRKPDEVRPLDIAVSILPRTHGSALFQRGETQALTVATLAGPSLKQLIEGPEGEESKRYIHHYFMPPYSLGQTGRMSGPGRREIGHGALAEKALLPVIPSEEDFPYTIRLVSEILSSNGSTSMASTCGSSLALMDAGVPISEPVAGISIGLVKEGEDYQLLTDIKGIEDFNGDMDFKVAGTKSGITAVQVDVKLAGLPLSLIKETLAKAKVAREMILEEMLKVIPKPRERVSQYAPKVKVVKIPEESIGSLIGPGGSNIRSLVEETDCAIDVDDDGKVTIVAGDKETLDKAVKRVRLITKRAEPGEEFQGKVTRVEPFGAFVEFLPGKEGLVHVSRMGQGFVKTAIGLLNKGQEVVVRLNKIDNQGRYDLTLLSPKIQGQSRPLRDSRRGEDRKRGSRDFRVR